MSPYWAQVPSVLNLLAAREMGHDVTVLEQGDVAAGVCRWGHVKMFTPSR